MKAISGLVNADDAQLRAIVKVWHRRARPFIRTKPFEETWLDFVTARRRCRLAEGGDLMLILEKAIATELPTDAADYEGGVLADVSPPDPFRAEKPERWRVSTSRRRSRPCGRFTR